MLESSLGFVFMINKPWWKPAVEVFTEVSTYIVVPIIVALVVGKTLDDRFGTEPWIFIGLAAVGFLYSCVGIYRTIKKYSEEIKKLNGDK